MVADALVYHPALAHYLRFVATTVGRDKILRTLQYFSRFYAWYLYRTNRPQAAIDPYNAIKKQFGTTRKILRVGKFVEHLKAAALASSNKSLVDPVIRYLAVGRQLGYAGYLTLDTITVVDAIGVRKLAAAKRLQESAYRSWMAGLACSAVAGVYTLFRLKEKEKTLDSQKGEDVVEAKKLKKEYSVARLQLFSDLCDLTVPVSALGLASLDDGIVGIAGTISSLIGIYSQWRKTA
ncbi:putative peroxisomal biogenesis factor [Aspergillus heteromorphus CBS 117.55]|uniref:Putative peroxisomal biogenesis factor n=1 Tax=Aspergillus heteromorphus CBS 117.55 TaxID=1448321 RepID=A0A317W5M6_9EURO|nr:putative peroxisomal biogenesis factor [Aspergillus heteromorphus CBS 117.55]PWY80537.1 putative peroxisomal biogenesis factor [Aspergillus heteromorphus CBS 117.55]